MSKAIGIIEGKGYVNAIRALDLIKDYGNLELLYMERNLGKFLVSVVVHGSLSEVKMAMDEAEKLLSTEGWAAVYIGNPHEQLLSYIKALGKKNQGPDDGGVV